MTIVLCDNKDLHLREENKKARRQNIKDICNVDFSYGIKKIRAKIWAFKSKHHLTEKGFPSPTSSNLLLIRLIYSKQFIIHEELHNCNCKLVISRYCWLSSFNKQICVCWFESTVAAYGLCVTAAMYQHQLFYYIYITCCSTFYITHVLGSRWQTWQPAAM